MSGKILGVENALEKDYDPSLTIYGILQTLDKSTNIGNRYTSNHVFVPCTIRTWMTATLLYIRNLPLKTDTLMLIVSPYLKEKDIGKFDIGNLPINIESQVKKYKRFLKLLNSYDAKIMKDKKIILYFFQNKYIIFNLKENNITSDNYFDPYPKNKQHHITVNETSINKDKLKPYISALTQEAFKINHANDNQDDQICDGDICSFPTIPTDKIDINNFTKLYNYDIDHYSYYDKYNIIHFIFWLHLSINYLREHIDNIHIDGIKINKFDAKNIFCVTHSQTMQDFMNYFLKNNKTLHNYNILKEQYDKYNKMNSWDIHLKNLNYNESIKINDIALYAGIPKMNNSQKKLLEEEFGKKFKTNNEQLCTFNRFSKTKGGKKKIRATRKKYNKL
jgi:hypothetical protein